MSMTFGDLYTAYTAASGADESAGADVAAKQSALNASVQAKAAADGALTTATAALAATLAGKPGLLLSDGTLLTTGPDGKLQPPVKVPTLTDVAVPDPEPVPVPTPTPEPAPVPNVPAAP